MTRQELEALRRKGVGGLTTIEEQIAVIESYLQALDDLAEREAALAGLVEATGALLVATSCLEQTEDCEPCGKCEACAAESALSDLTALAKSHDAAVREPLEADIRYLLKFVPPWAKEVPEGLCPTMYGTLTAEGDRKVKAEVDRIRMLCGWIFYRRRDAVLEDATIAEGSGTEEAGNG